LFVVVVASSLIDEGGVAGMEGGFGYSFCVDREINEKIENTPSSVC
jgi:hypothetical protein